MEKKHFAISSALLSLLTITSAASALQAQVLSSINISAASCMPRYADAFQGTAAEGFLWESDGSFRNHDHDDNEQLICAVPFDPSLRRPDGSIPSVEISVDVIDNHTGDEVRVDVFTQSSGGAGLVASENTSIPDFGRFTLVVTVRPGSSTRYIWFRVDVPDADGGNFSGVAGFRVRRL